MNTPSNQLSSLDILKSTEEKIQNLFGLSSLDTFACMNEDELVAKLVEQHQDKIESTMSCARFCRWRWTTTISGRIQATGFLVS